MTPPLYKSEYLGDGGLTGEKWVIHGQHEGHAMCVLGQIVQKGQPLSLYIVKCSCGEQYRMASYTISRALERASQQANLQIGDLWAETELALLLDGPEKGKLVPVTGPWEVHVENGNEYHVVPRGTDDWKFPIHYRFSHVLGEARAGHIASGPQEAGRTGTGLPEDDYDGPDGKGPDGRQQ